MTTRPRDQRSGPVVTIGIVAVIVVPLVVTIWLGADAYQRRDYPGPVIGPITSLLRSLADLAGLVTVGAIVSSMFLHRLRATRRLELTEAFDAMLVRRAAFWWAVLSVGLVIFEAVDSFGVDPIVLLRPADLLDLIGSSSYARAWIVAGIAATIIYATTYVMHRWWHLVVPLWLSLLAVVAPVAVGSVLVGPNHDFGSDAAIVLTCLNATLVGSATVLALRQVSGREVPPIALRRWARFGSFAAPVMLAAELLIVWFKLAGTSPVESLTGWFSLVRLACLAVIWWVARHMRRVGSESGLSVFPVAVGAGLVALAAHVAMTRFLSPQFYVDTSISQIFLGFDLPDAPTFAGLLFGWRPNVLFLATATSSLALYLAAVRRLRRAGDSWPVGRTVAWSAGCVVLVVATSSGFGKYSGADFAIHMGVHMALNMLAPLLLVLGGPVTLALRALHPSTPPGPREWIAGLIDSPLARAVYHPLIVFALFVGSYYALYLTGLFEYMSRDHWAHQVMNVHFVFVGMLYYGLVIGVDRTPFQLPHVARLGYLFAAMPFHAFFGIAVMSADRVIAFGYYSYLDMPWAGDLLQIQYLGGGIAWAGGEIPLVIVVVVLLAQWAIQDTREAKRKDRHIDSGVDDEFDAYNEMLRKLAERTALDPDGTGSSSQRSQRDHA